MTRTNFQRLSYSLSKRLQNTSIRRLISQKTEGTHRDGAQQGLSAVKGGRPWRKRIWITSHSFRDSNERVGKPRVHKRQAVSTVFGGCCWIEPQNTWQHMAVTPTKEQISPLTSVAQLPPHPEMSSTAASRRSGWSTASCTRMPAADGLVGCEHGAMKAVCCGCLLV